MTTDMPPPFGSRVVAGPSSPPPPLPPHASTSALTFTPPGPPTSVAPTAPTLPRVVGPVKPAIVPPTNGPARPWESRHGPTGVTPPSVAADGERENRRIARYGRPVAPVRRAIATAVALVGSLAASSWLLWVVLERRQLVVDLDGGSPVTVDMLAVSDDRVADAGVALLLSTVVSGIALMAWMFRAYKNVGAWRRIDYGAGWAIFAWLVPLLNLLRPGKIMLEIVEGSPLVGRRDALAAWWWITWVVSWFGTVALRSIEPETLGQFAFRDAVLAGTTAMLVVASVLLIVIIVRATSDQRRHIAATT